MGTWLDEFLTMKIVIGEDEDEELEEEVDEEELIEQQETLEALREELSVLQDEMGVLEANEPEDVLSDAYTRWESRRDLLEEQITDVEAEIEEIEAEFQN